MKTFFNHVNRYGHEEVEGKVYKCLMENIKDLQLRSWIFTHMDRGFFYNLQKKLISPKNLKRLIFNLNIFLGILGIILFYFDIFKDVLFFRILGHLWTNILVIVHLLIFTSSMFILYMTFLKSKYSILVYE